jgi:hypothetical protein
MKFLVTYQTDHARFDEWLKIPEDEREAANPQLKTAWDTWMEEHTSSLIETAGVGRPKRVTAAGTEDSRNDLMIYSFVEAVSLEAAADMFKDHPHLGMLNGWIEIMPVNSIS